MSALVACSEALQLVSGGTNESIEIRDTSLGRFNRFVRHAPARSQTGNEVLQGERRGISPQGTFKPFERLAAGDEPFANPEKSCRVPLFCDLDEPRGNVAIPLVALNNLLDRFS